MKNMCFHCFFNDLFARKHFKMFQQSSSSFCTGLDLLRPHPTHYQGSRGSVRSVSDVSGLFGPGPSSVRYRFPGPTSQKSRKNHDFSVEKSSNILQRNCLDFSTPCPKSLKNIIFRSKFHQQFFKKIV